MLEGLREACGHGGGRRAKRLSDALAEQERVADFFADGLRAWMRGDDTFEAEAAGIIVGEIAIRGLKWLRAQFEQKG